MWPWRPSVRIRLSTPQNQEKALGLFLIYSCFGLSPSGKATDFDSVIPQVRIPPAQPKSQHISCCFRQLVCCDFSVWGLCPLNGKDFTRFPLKKSLNTPEYESGLWHAPNRWNTVSKVSTLSKIAVYKLFFTAACLLRFFHR